MHDFIRSPRLRRTVLLLLALGFAAGLIGGLLGLGGGSFIVPALVFFLAFDQRRSHGTSLAVVLALSLTGVIMYSRHERIDLVVAAEIAVGAVLGAIVGVMTAQGIKSIAAKRLLSLLLIAIAVKMILDGWNLMHAPAALHPAHGAIAVTGLSLGAIATGIGAGILTGFLSALLGVGGGIITVPMLTVLLQLPQKEAQGISLAAMMPVAFAGMLKHYKLGNVEVRVAEWIAVGAGAGAILGSSLAVSLHSSTLKLVFGIFLIIVATLMAAKRK